jgi:hypothetical protein
MIELAMVQVECVASTAVQLVKLTANTGELDFGSGFTSTDPLFHKWCHELFVIHWNKKEQGCRSKKEL